VSQLWPAMFGVIGPFLSRLSATSVKFCLI
jgi:hypothetical protein